jgi:hypothetical protein
MASSAQCQYLQFPPGNGRLPRKKKLGQKDAAEAMRLWNVELPEYLSHANPAQL